jgi:hydroxysqualene dehydroxylase
VSRFARVHVVGAGLAGLAAALRLSEKGVAVILHDSAPQAGGRCRSYLDTTLGCRIDNGNHLLMSGNVAALRYLAAIGAADSLTGPAEAAYPFLDLVTGERWTVRPGKGRVPWWLLRRHRRVLGSRLRDYLAAFKLRKAGSLQTVNDRISRRSKLFHRFWRPFTTAALNTGVNEASALLLSRVLEESIFKGSAACRPLVPREGLSESFIDPALETLRKRNVDVRFVSRLRALEVNDERLVSLDFEAGGITLGADEAMVLAVPAPVAVRLVPGLDAPDQFRAIVNAHYRIALPADAPLFIGLVGGMAEWVFRKREVLSVTVSAADRLIDRTAEDLSARLWRDVERAYDLPPGPMPPVQIVKERRATFAASPPQIARRPPQRTQWPNLVLAGDWTDTGLPATIEGAIRSGFAAADRLLESA